MQFASFSFLHFYIPPNGHFTKKKRRISFSAFCKVVFDFGTIFQIILWKLFYPFEIQDFLAVVVYKCVASSITLIISLFYICHLVNHIHKKKKNFAICCYFIFKYHVKVKLKLLEKDDWRLEQVVSLMYNLAL